MQGGYVDDGLNALRTPSLVVRRLLHVTLLLRYTGRTWTPIIGTPAKGISVY
jgi:hypothetical protein